MSMVFYVQVDVKIGVVGFFIGFNVIYGVQYWKGVLQVVVDINVVGGIKGEKIVLVQGDDVCELKQVVVVVNWLVDEVKVFVVVGYFCFFLMMLVFEVYDEVGILIIIFGLINLQIIECGMKDFFCMCGCDDQQGVIVVNYMLDVLKVKKIVVIYDKDIYGQGLVDVICVVLVKWGIKEVLYEGFFCGEKDFNVLVIKIGVFKLDVVYFGGCYLEVGLLVCQMCEQGVQVKFFFGDCIVIEELVMVVGGLQFINGVLMIFGQDLCIFLDGKVVIEKFCVSGFELEGYIFYVYVFIQVIVVVWNVVGIDNVKVSDWLKSYDVEMVMGKKVWDGKGDFKVFDYVVYQWDDKGKYYQF